MAFRYLLLLVFISIQMSALIAQEGRMSFGLMGALNINELSEGDDRAYNFFHPTSSFTLGVFARHELSDMVKINTEILWSMKKYQEQMIEEEGRLPDVILTDKFINQQAITVPFYLTLNFERLHLLAGGYLDWSIQNQLTGPLTNPELQFRREENARDHGLLFGGFYHLGRIEIGLRKFWGLKKQDFLVVSEGTDNLKKIYRFSNLQLTTYIHL